MRLPIALTFIFFMVSSAVGGSTAADEMSRPSDIKGLTKVSVAVYILDVDEVHTSAQSFDANVYFEARWHDKRLVHDGSTEVSKPLTSVWHPRIQVINQQRLFPTFPKIVEITPEGEVIYRQRYWGSFSQPLELRDFPFDRQSFTMQIVAAGYYPDEVELIPEKPPISGIAEKFSVADWEILGWRIEAIPIEPAPNEDPMVGFTFYIEAEREAGYFILKVVIPLVFIVMMSWIVFWIDPKESSTQISVAITTMLTLIAYRFAVGALVPKISYLTRLDYFIFASTFLVFTILVQVIITSTLAKTDRLERARAIDFWARLVYPTVFLLVFLETLVFRYLL
jgi:hypothetical protein